MNKHGQDDRQRWIRAAVERYEGKLLRYAQHMTGNLELAREVVQDTFLKLCNETPAEVDPRLAPWLFTVCRNRAVDVIRKEKRMKSITQQQAEQEPAPGDSAPAAAENRENAIHVLQLVDGLSENQREVIRLKFQSGLSYREISEITSLSVSNVGYLLHTAVQRIRTKLNPS